METCEIHNRFKNSEYGKILENNIRFGDFKPEFVSNELWEYLLGDDVNNLRHMPHTLETTKKFARLHKLGGALLEKTAVTHDWGEAVVGDVALPDKELWGVDNREEEAYMKIAWEVIPEEDLSYVPEILWGEHPLKEPFNVIEYIGYCQTGLRAGKMALLLAGGIIKPELSRKQIDGLLGGLLSLNKQVEIKNFKKLSAYEEKYPKIIELFR